jgi:hypothetical protein
MDQGATASSFAEVLKAKSLSPAVAAEASEPGKVVPVERTEAAVELIAAMFAGSSGLVRAPAMSSNEPADEASDTQASLDPAATQPAIRPW